MDFSFAEALAALGVNVGARIANAARPPANYLFNTFLPERTLPTYHVEGASMVVKTTMAGLAAMDSPYPPGGAIEISTFLEQTAKLAISNTLTEGALRQLMTLMTQLQANGQMTNEFLQREALNFLQKVILQGMLDTAEWLRGQALVYGALNWSFNQKTLAVSYGIPAANFLTARTDANADSYSDTASAFWTDVAAARRLLRYNLRAAVLNSSTMDKILGNSVNALQIVSQDNARVRLRRYKLIGGVPIPEDDVRYSIDFIIYDEEAEVYDTTAGSLGTTQRVKFMPDGKILFVGQNSNSGYRVGQGSTDNPRNDLELGYYHIGPNVESGGRSGRWSRLYVPEGRPMMLTGESASNELPVLTAIDKLVVATTELLP